MLDLNVVGDTFYYFNDGNKGYSVHQKEAKNVRWHRNLDSAEYTVYVDIWNLSKRDLVPGKKIAWLYESKSYLPKPSKDYFNNINWYLKNFDYIFTHDQLVLKTSDKALFVPANGTWIDDPKIYPKTKMVSMITSNKSFTKGHKLRLDWSKKLASQGVDLYGKGFNFIEKKEQGLCDYMFSVAIENGFYESYFTEKIIDCFATGTIPIYLGSPDIAKFFNPDGIIFLDDNFSVKNLSKDYYYDRLNIIQENLHKAMEFRMPEDFFFNAYFKD